MGYSDAPAREAAWMRAVVSGLPVLDFASGGQFDLIDAYPRLVSQKPHQLFVWRSESIDRRIALSGEREFEHRMVAEIVWAAVRPQSEEHLDLALLDQGVDAVMARIRGNGDPTHGGRFWDQPGAITVVYGDVMVGLGAIDAPTSAGSAWVVRIAYSLVEPYSTAALQTDTLDTLTVDA